MKLTSLLQLVNKLQQAGKIDNLQQACGVFGCVHVIANDVCCRFANRVVCAFAVQREAELVWSFRMSPRGRRIPATGQLMQNQRGRDTFVYVLYSK